MLRIDCHRHMGGCCSVEFVWGIIQKLGLKHLGETEEEVRHQMTFRPDEPRGFHRFLDKFRILDEIKWTEDLIAQNIQSICDQLNKEQLDYTWMDFSINKYMDIGWHKIDAIKFIYDTFQTYRPNKVGLILSLKYESMQASQRQYAKLIEHEDAAKCLMGIDLVGDEEYFDTEFYKPIFQDWNKAKKMTRAHVGESQSLLNVKKAIADLNVANVAHGFKIVVSSKASKRDLFAWIKDKDVTFDMAITSNYLTGSWEDPNHHPITEMLRSGLKVTLGSDDPVQCSTTLNKEFKMAQKLGLTESECNQMRIIAEENSRRFSTSAIPCL